PPQPALRVSRRQMTSGLAGLLAFVLVLLLFLRPPGAPTGAPTATPPPQAGALPSPEVIVRPDCTDAPTGQRVRKQRDTDYRWHTVSQLDGKTPYVAVALERVEFCADSIVLHWSLHNGTAGIVQLGLNNANIKVNDNVTTDYRLREEGEVIRVRQQATGYGSVELLSPISPNATALTIELTGDPFGPQVFTIPVPAASLISDR
ncbi:MAG TPA: hypothetical protein VGE07_22520, partial [Herpetosiphonaceae bacterium]